MARTSLDVAAHCGQVEAVRFLLQQIQSRGLVLPKIGPLHWAAKEGHSAVVDVLIK